MQQQKGQRTGKGRVFSTVHLLFLLIIVVIVATPFPISQKPVGAEEGGNLPRIPGPSSRGADKLYRELRAMQPSDRRQDAPMQPSMPLQETAASKAEASNRWRRRSAPSRPASGQFGKRQVLKKPSVSERERQRGQQREEISPAKRELQVKKELQGQVKRQQKSQENSRRRLRREVLDFSIPQYYQGLYLNVRTARERQLYQPLIKKARRFGMNTVVVDVQPRLPKPHFMQLLGKEQFYPIARLVVFEGGLAYYPPHRRHLEKIIRTAERAAEIGFREIQLDYIRFTDDKKLPTISLAQRYKCMEDILKMAVERLQPYGVDISADLFGRVAFNQNDPIGQKLELFAQYMDSLYPMLYPSHFYGMSQRIRDPYQTVFLGTRNAVQRAAGQSRIIPYIQAFRMSIRESGLTFREYIHKQLQAARDAGSDGFIAWNARNSYEPFFQALKKYSNSRTKIKQQQ